MSRSPARSDTVTPLNTGKIMTVAGAIETAALGCTLPHEHVMSTFGAESARYPFYDVERLFSSVLPYLKRVKELGCQTLVDCTAAYFGRHPELLRRISQESGFNILTNTGYYGAAADRYVPAHAYHESADEIAGRWIREWRYSIDGTGVRPGFIKTAVDDGPLSEIDRRLLVAAVRTHLQTGLIIQTHTGNNWPVVQEMLTLLRREGAHPSAWIWVHAHQVQDTRAIAQAAAEGAWISFDGLNEQSAAHILALLQTMKEQRCLDQVLLSHDGDAHYGNGQFRPFHYLFTDFTATLRQNGFAEDEIHLLTVDNPQCAFTVRVRTTE